MMQDQTPYKKLKLICFLTILLMAVLILIQFSIPKVKALLFGRGHSKDGNFEAAYSFEAAYLKETTPTTLKAAEESPAVPNPTIPLSQDRNIMSLSEQSITEAELKQGIIGLMASSDAQKENLQNIRVGIFDGYIQVSFEESAAAVTINFIASQDKKRILVGRSDLKGLGGFPEYAQQVLAERLGRPVVAYIESRIDKARDYQISIKSDGINIVYL
ncbi:hypothetical protein HY419_00135 [candidate division WWE3 bacterium]|nr:hypothetical protein [candidate division WWE3 bacterium]